MGVKGGPGLFQFFGTSKTSAFLINAQSRFASVVRNGVLGHPPALTVAHLKLSMYLCSSGSNAQGEVRALERSRGREKAFQGYKTDT